MHHPRFEFLRHDVTRSDGGREQRPCN
jgi:hypothetical protein